MKGLEAVSTLMKMTKILSAHTQVYCITIPPSKTKSASIQTSLFNYRMAKLASDEKSVIQIINMEYQNKEVMLDENDMLSDLCIKTMAEVLNREVKPPPNLKSRKNDDPSPGASQEPHITKAVVKLQPNEIGRVIGKSGFMISKISDDNDVSMSIGKWLTPKKDDRDQYEEVLDGVMIEGMSDNVRKAMMKVEDIIKSCESSSKRPRMNSK
jgi:hypothetical protein